MLKPNDVQVVLYTKNDMSRRFSANCRRWVTNSKQPPAAEYVILHFYFYLCLLLCSIDYSVFKIFFSSLAYSSDCSCSSVMVAVGMVGVGMVRIGMVGVGMVPASQVSVCQKLWKYCEVWQSYCKNDKGAIFSPHSVLWFTCWSTMHVFSQVLVL